MLFVNTSFGDEILKNIIFCVTILIVTVFSMWYSEFKGISNSVVRLHIVANSDLPCDQNLKLKVRDYVINKYSFDNTDIKSNKQDIKETLDAITEDVNSYLIENGVNYTAKSDFGSFYFPTKHYENISLPMGNYTALKIVLGEGKGENWWCVMYPPLCFANNSYGTVSEDTLKKSLNSNQIQMISKPDYKFKTVEIINEFIHNIKN